MERRLAAILLADVVGYSRLIREDEHRTIESLNRVFGKIIRPAISRHQGRVVRIMGDGILAEFPSVVEALACAVEFQGALNDEFRQHGEDAIIRFRVGINLGDILIDGEDIHGDGVNVAARLEAMAEPGAIYVSGSVYDQVKGKLNVGFEPLGDKKLKNIDEKVRTYRVDFDHGHEQRARRPRSKSAGALIAIAAAAVSLLAALLYFWTPSDSSRPTPAGEALTLTDLKSLIPGTEFGELTKYGEKWMYFEYYAASDPDSKLGQITGFEGPCSTAADGDCSKATSSDPQRFAYGGGTWYFDERQDVGLHCVNYHDTPEEEYKCYYYRKTGEQYDRYLVETGEEDEYLGISQFFKGNVTGLE